MVPIFGSHEGLVWSELGPTAYPRNDLSRRGKQRQDTRHPTRGKHGTKRPSGEPNPTGEDPHEASSSCPRYCTSGLGTQPEHLGQTPHHTVRSARGEDLGPRQRDSPPLAGPTTQTTRGVRSGAIWATDCKERQRGRACAKRRTTQPTGNDKRTRQAHHPANDQHASERSRRPVGTTPSPRAVARIRAHLSLLLGTG